MRTKLCLWAGNGLIRFLPSGPGIFIVNAISEMPMIDSLIFVLAYDSWPSHPGFFHICPHHFRGPTRDQLYSSNYMHRQPWTISLWVYYVHIEELRNLSWTWYHKKRKKHYFQGSSFDVKIALLLPLRTLCFLGSLFHVAHLSSISQYQGSAREKGCEKSSCRNPLLCRLHSFS